MSSVVMSLCTTISTPPLVFDGWWFVLFVYSVAWNFDDIFWDEPRLIDNCDICVMVYLLANFIYLILNARGVP